MPYALSLGRKLFYSALILILFLILIESILRLTGVDTFVENRFFVMNRALDYPELFKKDRDLFWRFRPSQETASQFFKGRKIEINSSGLRGPEIDPVKTNKRIVSLGNSCTFGWALSDQVIFASQIGRRLGEGWESINAGIPGYSSLQGKRFLETDILPLKPDILLIMFGWNDHWAAASQIADKEQKLGSETMIALQNDLAQLHLYRMLKKIWLNRVDPNPDSTFDREHTVYRVSLADFEANLTEMVAIAREHGITPVLMTAPIPSLKQYYPRKITSPMHIQHEQYNDVTRRVARAQRVLLVDLDAEFVRGEELWDDPANDPIHFNVRGHSLATLTISTEIKRSGLLDRIK